MNIFLAGNIALKTPEEYLDLKAPFILQTFYDLQKWDDAYCQKVVTNPHRFFLDSGAFTFMASGRKTDWNDYAERYIDFIKRNRVRHFFELDLDTVIGIDATREITKKIERQTGMQCIPVFHACRGMDGWRRMCSEYRYIAIGASGITPECRWVKNQEILLSLLKIAHAQGCKVHGLGYTRLSNINHTVVPFDSVDSSSCLAGGRFATVYKFTGHSLIKKSIKGKSAGYKTLNRHNIGEWIKMCRYKTTEDLT